MTKIQKGSWVKKGDFGQEGGKNLLVKKRASDQDVNSKTRLGRKLQIPHGPGFSRREANGRTRSFRVRRLTAPACWQSRRQISTRPLRLLLSPTRTAQLRRSTFCAQRRGSGQVRSIPGRVAHTIRTSLPRCSIGGGFMVFDCEDKDYLPVNMLQHQPGQLCIHPRGEASGPPLRGSFPGSTSQSLPQQATSRLSARTCLRALACRAWVSTQKLSPAGSSTIISPRPLGLLPSIQLTP